MKQRRRPGLNLIAKASVMTSKTAKGIMSIIICVFTLSLWSWVSGYPLVAIPSTVSLGGMIVFLGLWVEKEADEEAKRCVSIFAKAIRLIGLKSEIGWFILMLGISFEIMFGIALAIREGCAEISNNPKSQPITSVRANAVFFVRGTNLWNQIDPVKDNHFVTLSIANHDWMRKNNAFKLNLRCRYFERYGGADDMEWVLKGVS